MGGVGTPELAAAVAGAGGLGMVPMGVEPPGTGVVGQNFVVALNSGLGMFSEAAGKASRSWDRQPDQASCFLLTMFSAIELFWPSSGMMAHAAR